MEEKRKTKAEIEEEVRRHVEKEKGAYKWVEKMALVDKIDEQECQKMINSIMVAHYSDITEERSISKTCGYPLCSNPLRKRTNQKFHISLQQQKVFDYSQRQQFCSDFCYKASNHLRSQIPESPIWLRKEELKISFLTRDQFLMRKNTTNVRCNEFKSDKYDIEEGTRESYKRFDQFERNKGERNREDIEKSHSTNIKASPKNNSTKVITQENTRNNETNLSYQQHVSTHIASSDTSTSKSSKGIYKNKKLDSVSSINATDIQHGQPFKTDAIQNVTAVLLEWLSPVPKDEFRKSGWNKEDKNNTQTSCNKETSDIQDHQAINSYATFQMRAINFLSNNPEWANESNINVNGPAQSKDIKDKSLASKEKNKSAPVIPLIHSKSQMPIRRKIVKEKINATLEKLHPVLELSRSSLVNIDFFKFVDGFGYTSRNVVMSTREWLLITVCLLLIYSFKCRLLKATLQNKDEKLDVFLQLSELPNYELVQNLVKNVLKKLNFVGTEKHLQSIKECGTISEKSDMVQTEEKDILPNDLGSDDDSDDDFFDMVARCNVRDDFDMEELD